MKRVFRLGALLAASVGLAVVDRANAKQAVGADDEVLALSTSSDAAATAASPTADASSTDPQELAKKLANPVANLISVPLQ